MATFIGLIMNSKCQQTLIIVIFEIFVYIWKYLLIKVQKKRLHKVAFS